MSPGVLPSAQYYFGNLASTAMLGADYIGFHVAQLCHLPQRARIENFIGEADRLQDGFDFSFVGHRLEVPMDGYKLPNDTYDLEAALDALPQIRELPTPLILITSLPFGDVDTSNLPDYAYFSGKLSSHEITIISTYLVDTDQCAIPLDAYIWIQLGIIVVEYLADLFFHDQTRGCLFDYCEDPRAAEVIMRTNTDLCRECEAQLQSRLRGGDINNLQIASFRRILARARGVRTCFVVMPFSAKLNKVYSVIRRSLSVAGWSVVRADDIARPRRITDAIVQAIMTADLVLVDITGSNPNVFYELGFAHAAGRDVIMLSQEPARATPFDIANERILFYETNAGGLQCLESDLTTLAARA